MKRNKDIEFIKDIDLEGYELLSSTRLFADFMWILIAIIATYLVVIMK